MITIIFGVFKEAYWLPRSHATRTRSLHIVVLGLIMRAYGSHRWGQFAISTVVLSETGPLFCVARNAGECPSTSLSYVLRFQCWPNAWNQSRVLVLLGGLIAEAAGGII